MEDTLGDYYGVNISPHTENTTGTSWYYIQQIGLRENLQDFQYFFRFSHEIWGFL